MTTRALVFDRDGVLTYFDVPSAAAYFAPLLPISVWELMREWQQYGDLHGFPTSLAAERRFLANFWDDVADRHRLSTQQRTALHAVDYTRFVCAFSDAQPVLMFARCAGYRVGVLSNFSLASLDASLAAAGLADWVDATCAATVIGAAKPQRAAYATIAATLGVRLEECLFFDDEAICVEGAQAAGMRAWLVDRCGCGAAPSVSVLHTLDEIPALLTNGA